VRRSLFAILIVLHLVPIWSFDYFLTQDGPIHLANTWTFFRLDAPDHAVFSEYYVRNLLPAPNWLTQWLLAGMLPWLSPAIAEKVIASGFLLLLPLSLRYALEAVRPSAGFLALLGFPLVFTWFLNMGLYNFCYGISIHFLVVGYWLRKRDSLDPKAISVLALGFVVLYFTHIFAVLAAGLTIFIVSIGEFELAWRRWCTTAVAVLPAVALVIVFVLGKQGRVGPPVLEGDVIRERAGAMLLFEPLVSFRAEEGWAYALFALLLFATYVALCVRRFFDLANMSRAVVVLPCVFGFLCLVMPGWALDGSFVSERLMYTAALCVILALGVHDFTNAQRLAVEVIVSLFAVVFVGFQYSSLATANRGLAEELSCGSYLEPGATLLPVPMTPHHRHDLFEHISNYWVMEHGIVNLGNFSAYRGNHPLLFREKFAPVPSIGCPECEPAVVEIDRYLATQQGRVDYVFAQGIDLTERLGTNYRSVCKSAPNGRAELFKRVTALPAR
jgi:hypothetical protein